MHSRSISSKIALFLFLATFIVFGNTLFHRFTYDDYRGVVQSEFIESFKNFPQLFTRAYFERTPEKSYRPVVTASYFLDHALWKKNPAGYHLTNVLIHALSVVLFYILTGNFLKEWQPRVFASLVFALHPVVCEPVNSVSFREDLLAGFFILSALLCLSYSSDRLRMLAFALSLAFALAAYFSKEAATPLILIPVLYLLLGQTERNERINLRPYLTGGSIHGLILLFYLLRRFVIMKPDVTDKTMALGGSSLVAASHCGFLFLMSWRLFLFPIDLNADYVFRDIKSVTLMAGGGFIFLLLYFVFMIVLYRRKSSGAVFSLAWILLFFLPVSNIIPLTNPFAERYLYIPLMGFALLTGLVYAYAGKRLEESDLYRYIPLVAACLVLLLAFLSVQRNLVWSTDETLWTATLKREPESVRALNGVAVSLIDKENYVEAENLLLKAVLLAPLDYELRNNLAVVYINTSRPDEAIEELKKAIILKPDYGKAHYNLARLYFYSKKADENTIRLHLRKARESGYPVPHELLEELQRRK